MDFRRKAGFILRQITIEPRAPMRSVFVGAGSWYALTSLAMVLSFGFQLGYLDMHACFVGYSCIFVGIPPLHLVRDARSVQCTALRNGYSRAI
jgi:hypothetical protein